MKFTSVIAALVTVSLVYATDPRVLARTDDTVEKRQNCGLIGFQCHPWYKNCPPCLEDLMANVTETAEAQPDAIVARDAVAAPCEPGKFGCTEPPREKRQTCHPGHECKPPKDIELEAQADTVEKRGGPIGIICYPWMACWKHGPPEVIKQLEAEAGTVEKRQGLIGFQCYPWMTCWPHVTEAEKQAST